MLTQWFLFETKLGNLILILLERSTGLAFVQADWLGAHCCGKPVDEAEAPSDRKLCSPQNQEVTNG